MKIKWNGHASFTITTSDGTVIVTDPYESGSYDGGIGYDPVEDRADVALISHEHPDHDHPQSLGGDPVVLRGSGKAAGIEFGGAMAAHDDKEGAERGTNFIFSFEADGIRVGFLGDLGHQLRDDQAKALGDVDVLFVPVGGVFTIDPDGASNLIERLKPRLVIPMHYKTEKCGFPLAGVDDFAKRMTAVKKTGQTEIELKKDGLPARGPEVWILEHAC